MGMEAGRSLARAVRPDGNQDRLTRFTPPARAGGEETRSAEGEGLSESAAATGGISSSAERLRQRIRPFPDVRFRPIADIRVGGHAPVHESISP